MRPFSCFCQEHRVLFQRRDRSRSTATTAADNEVSETSAGLLDRSSPEPEPLRTGDDLSPVPVLSRETTLADVGTSRYNSSRLGHPGSSLVDAVAVRDPHPPAAGKSALDSFAPSTSASSSAFLPTMNEPHRDDAATEATGVDTNVSASEPSVHSLPPCPVPWKHPLRFLAWATTLLFGLASLVLMLAVIAAIPVVNFIALGYLLEAQGQLARTGRWSRCFPLLGLAPRLGSIAFGIWFWLLLVRFVSDAASDARLIAPNSPADRGWNAALMAISVAVTLHLLLAIAAGGSFWSFFRPIRSARRVWSAVRKGEYWQQAEAGLSEFVNALRLPHHFWLGLRGFAGTFAWLFIPTVLFAALQDTNKPGQVLVMLLGGLVLIPVLSLVPFLQAHFAAQQKLSAFRDWRLMRELFARAPIRWFLAIVLLYTLALPLYLFKIAAPPQDALWFLTLIFIVTIYPAKLVVGWAYYCAQHTSTLHWRMVRWPLGWVLWPLLAFYLLMLFLTPAIGAAGRRVLFEHHALLLPTPF
jgi:hypothetical protein